MRRIASGTQGMAELSLREGLEARVPSVALAYPTRLGP
jgi:hypothetical protein